MVLGCNFSSQKKHAALCPQEYNNLEETGVKTAGIKMIPIETPVGKLKVWTKRIGNNPKIKVLLLHGGPALTHEYMECFESFFPQAGIEMYHYDQLGSKYSDQPKDSSLWTIAHFVEEVEQVRIALGLNKDNFYILGNSWGGILGMEYALKYQQNLKGLIVSNMMASFPEYNAYNAKLRAQMRKSLVDSLERYEQKGLYTDPVYVELVQKEYYNQHICRLKEWPEPINRSFANVNSEIYVMMQGPSEFKGGGRLLNWDIMDKLPSLTVPTLMIGAKYDTMDPEAMKKQSQLVKNGRFLYCENGSHLCMWDDQEVYMKGVLGFIEEVESGKVGKQ